MPSIHIVRSTHRGGRARRPLAAAVGLLALGGAALAACRDTTSPGFGVAVSVAAITGPRMGTDASGRPLVACDVGLEAAATGSGLASWMDAVFNIYAANNRTTPADSSVVPAATVRQSWQHEYIERDTVQRSGWTFTEDVPFVVTIEYRYQIIGGALESTKVSASCVPNVPAGAAPTLTALASDTASRLEPGEYLVLDFAATSPVGLWETSVQVAGPCDTTVFFADSLVHAITRAARVFLPVSCNLGVPLVATVAVSDGSLQSARRSLTLPALVDTTPPTIGINLGLSMPSGDFFVGDSILVLFGAWDNHALRSLNWTVSPQGLRDSLLVTGSWTDIWLSVPVAAGVSGPVQLTFFARDAAGNTSASVQTAPGAIRVFPSTTPGVVMGTIGNGVGNWTWDQRRALLYGTYDYSGLMYSVTRSAGTSSELAWMQQATSTVSLSPGGDSLIALLPGARSLAFVDLRSAGHPVGRVALSGIDSSFGVGTLAVMSNGKVLISAQDSAGVGHIYSYDLGNGTLTLRQDAGDGGDTGAGRLGVSPDGSVAVVLGGPGKFQRYDAATDTFGPLATARAGGTPLVADGGAVVAVGADLYDGNLRYLRTPEAMSTVPTGQPIALSPDGQTLYLAYGNVGVIRSRVSDGATIDRLRVPLAVNAAMSISPDGATLLVQKQTLSGGTDQFGLVAVPPLPAGAPQTGLAPAAARRATAPAPRRPSSSSGMPSDPRAAASR